MADTRDLVVISLRADFDRIERHVHRGDPEKLDQQVEMVLDQLDQDGLEDSFKLGSEVNSPAYRGRGGSRHPLPQTINY